MPVINPALVNVFGFWGSVVILKLLAMIPLTARQRFRKRVFANEGDTRFTPKSKVVYDDPDVERVRRCHLNDLENILPWFIITYIYLGTNPSVWLASNLMKGFVLSRIAHTLSYAVYPTQPARAIAFFIGYLIMGYQAIVSLLHYM
ncbi:microsomal glutathione S-transferase 1-like [Belonocnema kinseyi]|uniref:microsomal glutathione S-transferase 1-like n=1 Tax=Belonocnema kinseyi TaxID=2817044 RepID=UPI00143D561F|nr:microsomal glutathione S-transferase 1-like [Belonocnema kinseyi]XP_033215111.1 microsomal glutathione S-transferase 1-like [Belonocnema kinseyi]